MWPWGHLAVGYIVFTVWSRLITRNPPSGRTTLVLALATQLPDLVDKSLQFTLHLYEGRAIAHSLLVMIPFCVGAVLVARQYGQQQSATALTIGVITHLFGDSWRAILTNNVQSEAAYLLWPVLPAPSYAVDAPADHVDRLIAALTEAQGESLTDIVGSSMGVQLLLLLLFSVIWLVDGSPGFRTVWRTAVGWLLR